MTITYHGNWLELKKLLDEMDQMIDTIDFDSLTEDQWEKLKNIVNLDDIFDKMQAAKAKIEAEYDKSEEA